MRYLLDEYECAPNIFVDGYAEFDEDPSRGDPRRHRPDIVIVGFDGQLVRLSAWPHPKGSLRFELYNAIRNSLVDTDWPRICQQWRDEAGDRADGRRWAAYEQHYKPE